MVYSYFKWLESNVNNNKSSIKYFENNLGMNKKKMDLKRFYGVENSYFVGVQ